MRDSAQDRIIELTAMNFEVPSLPLSKLSDSAVTHPGLELFSPMQNSILYKAIEAIAAIVKISVTSVR